MLLSDLPGPFDVIYADPPWLYDQRHQEGRIDVEGHYSDMSLTDICHLPVAEITARNAILFMWVTGPCLEEGMQVVRSWGFEFKTVGFVWEKQRINPGSYTLSSCEFCLVGKRGTIPQPRGTRNECQFLSEIRGEHSAKPHEVRNRIERMFPEQRKLEMFARQHAPGWTSWGDEL